MQCSGLNKPIWNVILGQSLVISNTTSLKRSNIIIIFQELQRLNCLDAISVPNRTLLQQIKTLTYVLDNILVTWGPFDNIIQLQSRDA